jgi:hypothetical protein
MISAGSTNTSTVRAESSGTFVVQRPNAAATLVGALVGERSPRGLPSFLGRTKAAGPTTRGRPHAAGRRPPIEPAYRVATRD